jgi:hypothetical protein
VLTIAAVACAPSTPPPAPAPSAAPIQAPSVEDQAGDAALTAYSVFWDVSEKVLAAPGSRDWTSDLTSVASGQALDSLQADIANYANYPAHNQGNVGHAPTVQTAAVDSVSIVDCVDMTNYRLVADKTGEILTDVENQPAHFEYHAQVTRGGSGAWLVNQTKPELDKPC